MALPPTLAQSMWFAPASSTVHRDAAAANDAPLSEAERADLAYHHLKVSGGLERDEVKRAHAEEVRAGVLS